jgi:peptidoglycan/LPS O-acetylase OafA/YrhL
MALYLAFPLLIALAWSRRVWLLIALGCAASLWWLARTGHGSVSQGSALGDLVRGASSFFFGLLACRAFLGGRVGAIAGRVDLAVLALFWGAILLAANDVIPILICPLLILALAGGCGRVARILTSDIPHYLGDISYAVYLVHACVLGGLNLLAIRQDWLYAVAALGLTLAISAAANRWIERPARRLITGHQPSRL